MSHPHFSHLFSPIEVGGREVKNRVFVPGYNTAPLECGKIGDALSARTAAEAVLEGLQPAMAI